MRLILLVWFLAAGYLAFEAILVLNAIQADRQAVALSTDCRGRYAHR